MTGRMASLIAVQLLLVLLGVSIVLAGGMARVPVPIVAGAAAAPIDHTLHFLTLFLFAFAKTVRFVVSVVWCRRLCRAYYRLLLATFGAILWLLGLMLGEVTLELMGLVILCFSHCTECVMHGIEEILRDLGHHHDAPSHPA